jgi:hypothetical protein
MRTLATVSSHWRTSALIESRPVISRPARKFFFHVRHGIFNDVFNRVLICLSIAGQN